MLTVNHHPHLSLAEVWEWGYTSNMQQNIMIDDKINIF